MLQTSPSPAALTSPGPASALIDVILVTHHEDARALIQRIGALAPAVATREQARDSRMPRLLAAVQALVEEMELHMGREERVLFPLIRELESAPEVTEADTGALLSPVVCMKREHNFIDELLAEIRRLTDGYTPPAGARPDHIALLRDLEAFEVDTREHVHKENNLLFPMAMELAPPVR